MIATLSVADAHGSGYVPDMTLEETMRARLTELWEADTKGPRGRRRSKEQVADEAGVGADLLRKYFRGDSGMDLEKIDAVARVLGKDLVWVIGGIRHMSGLGKTPFVPVVDSGRYPMDAPPDKLPQALKDAAMGSSGSNPTDDETAHWVRLQEAFGNYKVGDWVALSPDAPVAYNDDIGAVALAETRFVLGTFRLFRNEECLVVAPNQLYGPGEFRRLGRVMAHLDRKLPR